MPVPAEPKAERSLELSQPPPRFPQWEQREERGRVG